MTISAADILTKARELISKPNGWTQGSFARDDEARGVDATSDSAVCFCSMGALHRATNDLYNTDMQNINMAEAHAIHALVNSLPPAFHGDIVIFNDSHNTNQDRVLEAFNKAIDYAK